MSNPVLPRGFRNNNPGNIRISQSGWIGKVPNIQNTDGSFEQFDTMEHGVRAMYVLLRNYLDKGHNTISAIIKRYAPSTENKTEDYIRFVSSKTGILPYMTVYEFNLKAIIDAMIQLENGQRLSKSVIDKGVALA